MKQAKCCTRIHPTRAASIFLSAPIISSTWRRKAATKAACRGAWPGCAGTMNTESKLARRDRLFAAVIVETALGLSPKPAGLDILHQERARPVFGIGQPLVQHLHDRQTSVEADEVGKLERPHRMMGAEPHRGVDCLNVSDALIERIDCLVDHRQQNTVDDERGEVL